MKRVKLRVEVSSN